MKKQLLLMSAAALASGFAMAAPQTVTFSASPLTPPASCEDVRANAAGGDRYLVYSKAGEPSNIYTLNDMPKKCTVYLAAEMTVADQQPYIGCTITSVNVMAGSALSGGNFLISTVNAFVTDNINSVPTDVTTADIDRTPYAITSIELEKPVVITGEKNLYFGYNFAYSSLRASYFLPCDDMPTSASENNNLVAVTTEDGEIPSYANYSTQTPGSLCVSINISGDNLPENLGSVTNVNVPSYMSGSTLAYEMTLKNVGSNDITSCAVKTSSSNGTVHQTMITLGQPLAPGRSQTVSVSDVPNEKEGVFYLTASLVEVNGVPVENPASVTSVYGSYSQGYTRRPVMEEATGTWCGWCPAGIVMMETLAKSYPDWIRIAVHNGDRMAVASYNQFVNEYVPGFPYAIANRTVGVYPTGVTSQTYVELNNMFTKDPAYAELSFEATCSEDQNEVEVTCETEVCCEVQVPHRLAFVIVEDNVGPYSQSNYYAGGASGPMGGFENEGSSFTTYFDDVARLLVGYPGIENSLPALMNAGEKYTYNLNMSVANVTNSWFRVVAMLVNMESGEIMNAQEKVVYKDNGAGVEGVASDNAIVIKGGYGEVIVSGAHNVAVFTLDGRRVAETGLAAGVYIVKADGVSGKVVVK